MYGAFARTKSFTGNSIAKWDISSVTDLRYIFYDISSSFDSENIHGWNIQEVSEFDNIFSDTDLTACQKYVLYNAWSDQSSVFWSAYSSWGSTTQECGCQIGYSEDALWLALASWTSNEVAHLVCGENITLWDTTKLTVLNDETMYVVFSRLLLSQKFQSPFLVISRISLKSQRCQFYPHLCDPKITPTHTRF